MTEQELNELNEFLFGTGSCEYDKRRKCDSFYIMKYNDQLQRIHDLIIYLKGIDIPEDIKDKIKEILEEKIVEE